MEQSKGSKWIFILISIILAFSFWLFVQTEDTNDRDKTVNNIPVILSRESVLEDQNLMVTDISSERVSLSWHGPFSVVRLLDSTNVSVSVDVSRITEPGTYELTYDVNYPSTVAYSSISLQSSNPESISVTVSRISSRDIEIQPFLRGGVAEGYQAGEFTVFPESVYITGTESEVNKIRAVYVILEQEELSESFAGDLPLILVDDQGNELSSEGLRLSTETAYVTLPVVVIREIELAVDFIPGGGATSQNVTYRIDPPTITVSGSKKDVEYLSSISLGSIDLSQVMGSKVTEFPIYMPDGVENISGFATATVRVTVRGLSTKEFEVDNIQTINVPEGYTATLSTLVRTVVVRGPEEALSRVYASQISMVADLSGYTATGSCSVPARVILTGSDEVGVIGEYTVVVNLSRS